MNFDLCKPCPDCPFLRTRGYLTKARAKEIAVSMTGNGSTFACHKTTAHDDDGEQIMTAKEQHCAGALLFMERVNPSGTQMVRIAERLGIYDASKLHGAELVYDSIREMVAGHSEPLHLMQGRLKGGMEMNVRLCDGGRNEAHDETSH